ncbi:hypothetical protein CAPTEDRAFT_134305 [Capitella teleta]|uniref:Uncharacterized protein n=1 Tax=Capitella teleta TaxID=283909 RepID=R7TNV2_CAPTE|nr:hypothetical protein CAPTEDRAFT_134305 [Capitella teleta]|eukprot:ELT95232.1 hypothetical protein CAPTEDRAFT_134305 [Capitella teleta]
MLALIAIEFICDSFLFSLMVFMTKNFSLMFISLFSSELIRVLFEGDDGGLGFFESI